MDDIALVRLVLSGSDEAFHRLVVSHQRLCWVIIGRLVDERDDVLDLAQDCFLQVYRHLHNFRFDSSLRTWIAQIAYTTACRHLRRRRGDPHADSWVSCEEDEAVLTLPSEIDVEQEAMRQQDAMHVHRAMAALDRTQRVLVQMFYFEDFTVAEIAEATQLPEGTIKSHLYRARAKLRDNLHRAA